MVTLFLGLMSFVQVREIKAYLVYPATETLSIKQVDGAKSNQEHFKILDEFATTRQIELYYPIVKSGKTETFTFGKGEDLNKLKNSYVVGGYWSSAKINEDGLNTLKNSGIISETYPAFLPQMSGFALLFGGLKSLITWGIIITFITILTLLKLLKSKAAVIKRSLGTLKRYLVTELVTDILTYLGCSLVIFTLVGIFNGGLSYVNVFPMIFALFITLFGVIGLLLVVMNLLVFWVIQFSNPIAIFKNKLPNRGFLGILSILNLSVLIIFGTSLIKTIKTVQPIYETYHSVSQWRNYQDYLTYSRHGLDNPNIMDEDHRLDSNQMVEELKYTQKWADFYMSYPKNKVITNMKMNWEDENIEKTAYSLQNIHFVNAQFLKANQEMGYLDELPEPSKNHFYTIYLPEKYANEKQRLEKILDSEALTSNEKTSDSQFVMIKNDSETFQFNSMIEGQKIPEQLKKDQIFVVVNLDLLNMAEIVAADLPRALSENSIFESHSFDKVAKKTDVQKGILDTTNVYQRMSAYVTELFNSLLANSVSLVLLFIFQIVILYKFISLAIRLKAKQLSITALYNPKSKKIFVLILGLAVGINVMSSACVLMLTQEIRFVLTMMGFLVVESVGLMLIAASNLRKYRVQILKGEVEVL
jgi:hypothetical protein